MTEYSKRALIIRIRGMKLRSWLLALSVGVVVVGVAISLLSVGSHPTPEQRMTRIEAEVKCPSCDGISSLDSNTAGAFAVRSFVEQQVKAGKSNRFIINALEASYGPTILMSPPASSGGTIIAALPFVFVAVVLGLMGFFGYRRRRRYELSGPDGQPGVEGGESGSESEAGVMGFLFDAGGASGYKSEAGSISKDSEYSESRNFISKPRRVGSIRQSWVLYLGVLLLLGGVGSALWIVRSQDNLQKQLVASAVQARNEAQTILRARTLANQGQDVQALQLLSSVLEVDPNQPVALTYQGWLLRQAGEKDKNPALINQGQQFLEKAVKLDPSYPDAHVFLGYILFQDRHEPKLASVQFSAFLADKPSVSFISATKSVMIDAYKQAGLQIPPQLS
ncbi:MAG: hypothetical protein HKL84_07120 [Acidimicrobiaceae bacterium]|nr:hypothetical protein [Acidimicrobiaceae bacterium]